jgi:CxxC-x17-CxxC domain-containing protein
MKKKSPKNVDVTQVMIQIQGQLASLDKKLDAFINKSLTDIAQALAAQKTAIAPRPVAPAPSLPVARTLEPPRRPMFAIVCYECGKDSELPFKPAPGRPVYCKECFGKRKGGHAASVNNEVKLPSAPTIAIKTPEPAVKAKKKTAVAKKPVAKKKTVTKKKK